MNHIRSFLVVSLFIISTSCYSVTLKITIMSSQENVKLVYFSVSRVARLAYFPITAQGQELDGISEGNLPHSSYSRIIFDFDDDLERVTLGEEVQTRLLQWLNEGSKSCIAYSPNRLRLLVETGKTFLESGQEESSKSNCFAFAFAYFVHRAMTDFTGIGFKTKSNKVSLSELKQGDLVILRSNKIKFVLHAMLYIGNQVFMSIAQGAMFPPIVVLLTPYVYRATDVPYKVEI